VDDERHEPFSAVPGTPSPPPSLGAHTPVAADAPAASATVPFDTPSATPAAPPPLEPPPTAPSGPNWSPPPAPPAGPQWPSDPTPPAGAPPYGGPVSSVWPTSPPPPPPPSRTRPPWLVVAVVAALIGGGVGAGIAEAVGTGNNSPGTPTIRVGAASPGPALAGGASIPAIVKKILPEVVSIDAKGPASDSGQGLFGATGGGTQEDQGTGMIISTDGEVITNNHVISGATSISVTLYGQTKSLPTTLVGADPSSDVALLKIDAPPSDLQAITFGDSHQLEVGDAVIAVGNALGLSAGTPTVTSGIVSATGRTVQAGDTGTATETLTNIIQTDAAINSGNSGGALVDSNGQVIGMNTAVASSSSGNAPAQNIGFAIPASTIETLLSQLRQGGTSQASKAYIGVLVEDVTSQIRQAYGLTPTSGAVVVSVEAGSPAEKAGLKQADVIISYDGKAVTTSQNLTTDVQASPVGKNVSLVLWRGTKKMTVSVTLGQAPAG
jgi:S1-C subfamily serine protease